MKKHTKILSLILAVIMIMSVMPMTASADEAIINVGEHITLTWDNNDTLVISGSGAMSESMTEELQNYLINEIKPYVKKIIISEDVMNVYYIIEQMLTMINSDIGSGRGKIECIEVAEENPYFCSVDGVMYNKDMTELIFYPRCLNATSFIIPDSVKTIGLAAFFWCDNLESITMSDNVETIEDHAFYYCFSLKDVTFSKNLKTIERFAFYVCRELEEIIIPDGTESIKLYAFAGCENLKSVYIPKSIQYINCNAFIGTDALTEINYCGTEEDWNNIIIDNKDEIWGINGPYDDDIYSKTINFESHINNNGDGLCDGCGILLTNCSCNCHSTNSFISFFWKILNFFQRIFGTNRTCECGMAHY